ncbi:MAG: hypothetical protein ABEK03_09445 [Candidatus Bipolaricaulia bacterium]
MALIALLAQTLATGFMVGLIWFVQVVHYPLLAHVGREAFPNYEAEHTRRTGYVVAPVMLVELFTAAWMLLDPPADVPLIWPAVGAVLVVAIWVTTGLVQVPLHRRLSAGFSVEAHGVLVRSNWVRTALWSLRGLVVLGIWAQLAW